MTLPLPALHGLPADLPAAISTIIVSPTARPRPIITAENNPLIAVGITLLSAYEHARDRAALEQVLDRLDMIEQDIDGIRRGTLMLSPDETSTTNGRTARMARARRQS